MISIKKTILGVVYDMFSVITFLMLCAVSCASVVLTLVWSPEVSNGCHWRDDIQLAEKSECHS
jgi:hypothetical protein